MKTPFRTRSPLPLDLTSRGRRVLAIARALPALRTSLVLTGLMIASSAEAATPVNVPAASRFETTPRTVNGDGLCAQFAAANAAGTVNNSTLAVQLLTNAPGAPAQAPPSGVNNGITNFFGVTSLLDYDDDTGPHGGFTYNLLFPWSKSSSGQICQSHQPPTPSCATPSRPA